MSPHYLVKLEILITLVLPMRCQRKKLQNLSHLNYGLQIRQIDYSMCRNTDLDELKQRLKMACTKLDHVVIAAAIRQWRHIDADQ